MRMMNKWGLALLAACGMNVLSAKAITADDIYEPYAPDGIPFVIAEEDWYPDSVGNHRAVVKVTETDGKKVAKVVLDWRRPDRNPEQKGVVVVAAATGKKMAHVQATDVTAERGEVTFLPEAGDGTYYVYYMPYHFRAAYATGRGAPDWNDYLKPETTVDNLLENADREANVKVERFESRNRFEFFTSMGNVATRQETEELMERHPENPVVFTEDRCFPIHVGTKLPVKWIIKEPSAHFVGTAMRNEYYVWQIGVWAPRIEARKLKVEFSDLKLVGGNSSIGKDGMTCFNQEGVNWDGKPMKMDVNVGKGRVQALWCGMQIPEKAVPGTYKGVATLTGEGMQDRQIEVTIHVADKLLADKGDGDLWRLARLRWLNSTLGEDNHAVRPFTAMKVNGQQITATEKTVKLHRNGLLQSVVVNGKEALMRPMSFVVKTDGGEVKFDAFNLAVSQKSDGLVAWTSSQTKDGLKMECHAQMEGDGYVNYQIQVSSQQNMKVGDICLQTDYSPYASAYMIGAAFDGGKRPRDYTWNWTGPFDSYWMGNALVGLHVEFRGGAYHGPLLNDYKPAPPAMWANEGKGRISFSGGKSARVVASTGEMELTAHPQTFEFAINITPTKPLNTKEQLSMRFCHGKKYWLYDDAAETGANVFNIHHATELNPYINYPFVVKDSLRDFIRQQHQKNHKIKLYYTVRELTNHVAEIYALQSLGSEIIADGNGNGAPWLCEHLVEGFSQAWYTPIRGRTGDPDASFVMTPHSRWINYYLEGLRWMIENYGIDGLYMDDVSFDRTIMKRLRKIMDSYGDGYLIDLHAATTYSIGPANQYTDFFPYINRLWFGEYFKYNEMTADEWFVTCSGIPFGLMSEMLQDGGNPYLGMVYGSTARHSYGHPEPIWKLWRDFGIEDSKMMGYWEEKCPVSVTGSEEVKVTAFVKNDKILLAIGNFSKQPQSVKLNIDWKTLKMNPKEVRMYAPKVEDFQEPKAFGIQDNIPVESKKGWFLVIQKN